eukprot:TRINITY_DN5379_c0_g1_i1.p1 TRINITY_DN5379_c0_g1~~TRINITY_DN5379_c0_g1_i1.p1  ORF type:complete len:104 (+),score=19.15 TRINITY_DN5379_c0_g1_i1:340-651(+)
MNEDTWGTNSSPSSSLSSTKKDFLGPRLLQISLLVEVPHEDFHLSSRTQSEDESVIHLKHPISSLHVEYFRLRSNATIKNGLTLSDKLFQLKASWIRPANQQS